MQACNAYAPSSHYETFGIVLIEVLFCGKPVIATACGGPKYIADKNNRILISPKSIEDIGKAMATMRENIGNYDCVSISKDCIKQYGEKAIIEQLSNIYQDVLSTETG